VGQVYRLLFFYLKALYRVLVEKPEGKRPLRRHRYRWEDNIKMDVQKIGWEGKDWTDPDQNTKDWRALVNEVMNFRVP
jgi:hypothetical protein